MWRHNKLDVVNLQQVPKLNNPVTHHRQYPRHANSGSRAERAKEALF